MSYRLWLIGLLLWTVAGCQPTVTTADLSTAVPPAASQNSLPVVALPGMTTPRAAHTATLLDSGQVLIAGGFGLDEQALDGAELFDPATRTFLPAAALSAPRLSHTATRLLDGRVLIAGGYNGAYLASAELFDPTTGTFQATGSLLTARSEHVAVLLRDGRVLIVGGVGAGWTFLDSAEVYDPQTGAFAPAGRMTVPRESHTATLLPDGFVLIAGGHQGRRAAMTLYTSAELFDPVTSTFAPVGSMSVRRHKHDAVQLPDGAVLVTGGADERDDRGAYSSAERYDPARQRFAPAGSMHVTRYKHRGTSLLLPDGQVLMLGGSDRIERYDSVADSFQVVATSHAFPARLFATATLLRNGDVLFAGGYGPTVAVSSQAWLLTP